LADRGRLRIVTFHGVGRAVDDPFSLEPRKLNEFLRIVRDEGYLTLRACDLAGRPREKGQSCRAVVLTFDDGYAAHHDVVGEKLAHFGLVGTFFVITSFLQERRSTHHFNGRPQAFMSADDLRGLVSIGMDVGSHSHSHALMGALSSARARQEAGLSKQLLEQCIARSVSAFAYPYGRRNAYSRLTRTVLEECGYVTAFTQQGTPIGPLSDPLELPRISIDATDTVRTFRRKLYGQYELMAKVKAHVRRD